MTDRARGPAERTDRSTAPTDGPDRSTAATDGSDRSTAPTDGSSRPTIATDDPTTTDPQMTRADRPHRRDAQTLRHVSHTHPDTDRTFGGNFTFARAGAVAPDGGRPDVVPEDGADPDDEEPETLEDVEHTPPNESDDANRVFVRGVEGPQPADEDGPVAAAEGAPPSADEDDTVGDDEREAHADSDDPEDE